MPKKTNGVGADPRDAAVGLEHRYEETPEDRESDANGPCVEAQSGSIVGHSRPYRVLWPREVFEPVALSQSHVYRLMEQHRLPRCVLLGDQVDGLPEHVLDAFRVSRPE